MPITPPFKIFFLFHLVASIAIILSPSIILPFSSDIVIIVLLKEIKQLEKITRKSEKYPFINSKIINQKNQLNNIVRINGFYFADIKTEIINNNNNSIDLIYNFNLGSNQSLKLSPNKLNENTAILTANPG